VSVGTVFVVAHPHPAVRALESGLSLPRFRRALAAGGDLDHLPPHGDALTPRGRDELLRWLRSWGCRHLRLKDHARTSRSLRAWASEWVPLLPRRSLVDLSARQVEGSAAAYEALAIRPAASAARAGGPVTVTFGPTASAKALYALRPSAFPPWDAPMRAELGFGDDAEAYARYLDLCAQGVRATARRAGIEPSDLPRALGRPRTTAARLVDEYLWLTLTRGARL
jgi:hypothetical protein